MRMFTYDELKKRSVFFMLKPSKTIYFFLFIFFLFVCVLLLWLGFAKIDETVKATAILKTEQPVSSIKCVNSGKVIYKNFSSEKHVNVNEVLFKIDISAVEKELKNIEEKIIENDLLLFENECLLETIEENAIPVKILEKQNEDIYNKCRSYLLQKEQYELQVEEKKVLFLREKQLPKELYIPVNVEDLERDYRKCIIDYNIWSNDYYLSIKEDCKNLQKTRDSLEQQILACKNEIQNSIVISPISGDILEIKKFNVGDYIFSGEEILRIVPSKDASFYAEVYVPSTEIGKIKTGNKVTFKFSGFPPSKYKPIFSVVDTISADTITIESKNYYIIKCLIEKDYIESKNGIEVHLISGLTAEAKIVAESNTGLKMIFDKIVD